MTSLRRNVILLLAFTMLCFIASAADIEDSLHGPIMHKYMQIHNDLIEKQDPFNKQYEVSQLKSLNDNAFTLDTLTLYSVYSNPAKFTYTHTENGNIENVLKEILENEIWVPFSLKTSTYDSAGNEILVIWQSWNNGSWINSSKISNTYSIDKKLVNSIRQNWEDGQWQNDIQETYTYNSSGDPVAILVETWKDNAWENSTHEIYTYDEDGNLLTAFGEVWDSIWVNDHQHTYDYDNAGNMLSWLSEDWDSTNWLNVYKESYTYENNNRITKIGEIWINDAWVFDQSFEYSYNELDYVTDVMIDRWEEDNWVSYQKQNFTYDTYGGMETKNLSEWTEGDWANVSYHQNTYDAFGNVKTGQYFVWNGDTWEQSDDGTIRVFYDYSTEYYDFTGYRTEAEYTSLYVNKSEKEGKADFDISISPNPTADIAFLLIDSPKQTDLNLRLFDIHGKLQQEILNNRIMKGMNAIGLDLNDSESGQYILLIYGENISESIKVILHK